MVTRIFVEKKPGFDREAVSLAHDLRKMGVFGLQSVRILRRYDVEGLSDADFEKCLPVVFSEPPVDEVYTDIPKEYEYTVLCSEYLPGQFDQRADSAAQCAQLLCGGEKPRVRTANVYLFSGSITPQNYEKAASYLINPVESRRASMDKPDTLLESYPVPEDVQTLSSFLTLDEQGRKKLIQTLSLAMDEKDLAFCQEYFQGEKRCPTMTEIRMLDTYWSDHCRHTTFLTHLTDLESGEGPQRKALENYLALREKLKIKKPVTLMDMATLGMKALKKQGVLTKLDESPEINACTVKMEITVDGKNENWLLLFKNETHNHPTEIEPFGGAATCIGGAIRDPLSGRAYVYGAMRVTGAGDPFQDPMPGKLPQKKLTRTAAAGYSSYGNQIGLATGQVSEWYHPGYAAKRLEIGAVIGAAPEKNVRREEPLPGDIIYLIGGRTGRDGIGGATGSSKAHNTSSLTTCGAQVQKGNAPEERKLQRLFRNPEFTRLVKRCNDFGAGGVSVAVGEVADGLIINLDQVPLKYQGLDGTEIAISESQERMAVAVAPEDGEKVEALCDQENLECAMVAIVTEEKRLKMMWRGKQVVDISREFLSSNGASRAQSVHLPDYCVPHHDISLSGSFKEKVLTVAGSLNTGTQQGLSERFDSTIGAGTVLMPFGGVRQMTPTQAMVQKVSVEKGETDAVTMMAWGFDPYLSEQSPYAGGYLSVVEAASRLIATGAGQNQIYLTQQEYFPRPGKDNARWGLPAAALLGSLQAQLDLSLPSIGGKDSMSGSFEKIDVPPTLCTFAVTQDTLSCVKSNEFKSPNHQLCLLLPKTDAFSLPLPESQKAVWARVREALSTGQAVSAWALGHGGAMEGIIKMMLGNGLGVEFVPGVSNDTLFNWHFGGFLLECVDAPQGSEVLGLLTRESGIFSREEKLITLAELTNVYEKTGEKVFARYTEENRTRPALVPSVSVPRPVSHASVSKPRVLIPVFPGTNCEYDSARAVAKAGLEPEIFVINNLSADKIEDSARELSKRISQSQILFLPGGFSGGDEPDGSGKFIVSFLRNPLVADEISKLLEQRKGLALGICNGFQALIKLGLLPLGRIADATQMSPTLTFNTIGRHQSRLVRTRVTNNFSPWLQKLELGSIITVPISHGEGRFVCPKEEMAQLLKNGQIATQYVDLEGYPTYDINFNPNGSDMAVECITSPDGRVLGKMGHSERVGAGLYQNVPGDYDMKLFESAKAYFA